MKLQKFNDKNYYPYFHFRDFYIIPNGVSEKLLSRLLKGFKEDNHLSEVIEALQDPSLRVRQEAVSALVNFGSKIQSNLIQMFDDPNEDVINEAINSVRKLELKLPMALRNCLPITPPP